MVEVQHKQVVVVVQLVQQVENLVMVEILEHIPMAIEGHMEVVATTVAAEVRGIQDLVVAHHLYQDMQE